jgi:DNA-binding transcriptional LysR family regulator
MQIENLKTLLILAEKKSFSLAAQSLFISQPALTQQIQKMEKELGFELVDRSSRRTFALTPAGERFLSFAHQTVSSYQEALRECRQLVHGITEIRIGLALTGLPLLPTSLIASYEKTYPECKAELSYALHKDLFQKLSDHLVDTVFLPEPASLPSTYTFHPSSLDDFAMFVMAGHPLAEQEKIQPEDLNQRVIRMPEEDLFQDYDSLRKGLIRACPEIIIENTSSLPSYGNEADITIGNMAEKNCFPDMKAVRLDTDQKITYGFITRTDVRQSVLDFIHLAQEQ